MKTNLLTLIALHLGVAAVLPQPVITNQPQSQTNIVGATVAFTVGATGAPPLSYQWVFNTPSNRLPGATNDTLLLLNVQASNAGIYRVVITNDSGSVQSASARLTVLLPPGISVQPASQLAEVGYPAAISVTVTGTPPFSYQWLFNGQTLAGETRSNVAWTSAQLSNSGPYSVVITNVAGSVTSQVATLAVGPPIFARVTNGPIATDAGFSWACAWADYDNDGWIDLLVANEYDPSIGQTQTSALYLNQRNGNFVRVTNSVTTVAGPSIGLAWADFDNDGQLDLFVANATRQTNFLFQSTGNGGFTRIIEGPIVTERGRFHGGTWGDFDNDGLVDLFVVTFRTPDEPFTAPNFLYHNLGDGHFSRVEFDPLVATNRTTSSSSVTWCDFDNDGDLDLFLADGGHVGAQRNDLYRNDGNGVFTHLTNSLPALDGGHSASSAWGDYDNDGYPDLFIANITSIERGNNFLYHNNGDGTFMRITNGPVANDAADSYGCAWADYDNDGYLDLFVANGEYFLQKNFLYHNNGDGTFSKVTAGPVANDLGASAGCAWGDYDNDGFVDLSVSNYFGESGQPPQRNFLYRNNGNSNAWLNVKLVGTVSNRSAIGAKVRIRATIGGRTMWQLREVSGGSGFGSQNDMRSNFGLGDATNVDTVRIGWPSGTVQELHDVAAKQFLTITEPPRLTAARVNGPQEFLLKGGRGMPYDIEASTNLTVWSLITTVTITNLNGTAPIGDPALPAGRQKFYRAMAR